MSLEEYLYFRFNRNNVNKYRKYASEWVQNVTDIQKEYFVKEKEHLGL